MMEKLVDYMLGNGDRKYLVICGTVVTAIGLWGALIGFTSVTALAMTVVFGLVIVMNMELIHQIVSGMLSKKQIETKKE